MGAGRLGSTYEREKWEEPVGELKVDSAQRGEDEDIVCGEG